MSAECTSAAFSWISDVELFGCAEIEVKQLHLKLNKLQVHTEVLLGGPGMAEVGLKYLKR